MLELSGFLTNMRARQSRPAQGHIFILGQAGTLLYPKYAAHMTYVRLLTLLTMIRGICGGSLRNMVHPIPDACRLLLQDEPPRPILTNLLRTHTQTHRDSNEGSA